MEFDKNRILTSVAADQANGGDWGWFADTVSGMKRTVQEKQPLRLAHIGGEDKVARFFSERCNLGWYLFYPTPYEYFQAKWVEENRLQIGDKVRVTKSWKHNERGFRRAYVTHYLGVVGSVVGINEDSINIQAEKFQAGVPYYAIEKVKEPEYRPFASAEEFRPYRGEWWEHREYNRILRVAGYDCGGVWVGKTYETYKDFYLLYKHSDTGTPAGVEL